ncbi:MAG: hypothetical protein WCR46_15685 [Deltaproteobacteria bacterium]|jgi:hypothetical protein
MTLAAIDNSTFPNGKVETQTRVTSEETYPATILLAAIAAADGTVSTKTVQRTLDNSTLSNDKVEPTKTIGKDGKARPTKYVKTPKKRTA